jgi:hypothetical protein
MKNIGIFYDHLVYFTAIGDILWPLVYVVCGNLVYFPPLGILDQEKSGNPDQLVSSLSMSSTRFHPMQ